MTDALTINSITMPLSADGVRAGEIEIAERGRAMSGAYLGTRLAGSIKRTWSGRLVTTDKQAAWCIRRMLNGEGYGFSFGSDLRDDWKGNQGWSTTYATREAGGKYSAGQMSIPATRQSAWSFPSSWDPLRWTVSLWSYESSVWYHYVKIYGTATVWKDGVAGVAQPAWLTSDSSGIYLAGDAGTAHKYSEILIWPMKVPATWPALIYARTGAMKKPPFVGALGVVTYTEEATASEYSCRGEAMSVGLENRGASDPLQRIDFSLEEK